MRPASRPSKTRGFAWLWAIALGLACSDPLGPEEDRLSAARDRWRGAELDSYAFEFQRSCFCGLSTLRPVFITVVGGTVSSATFVDTGE
ncbi:MAG: DUF6174 domain-containing protein, partial [Gemmatimonadota bacterium]|nr:DUF6174 domain-containing protein [Gemmatimonadota bacterium]